MDEVSPRQQRKASRQASRREALVEATRQVLLAEGLEGLTMAAVAEQAGTSIPSLYYYFASRQALIDALAVAQLREDVDRMEAAALAAPTAAEALTAAITAHVHHYTTHPKRFALYDSLSRAGLSTEALTTAIYPLSARINDILEQRLRSGQEEGTVHPAVQPRQLANVAWCTAQGILLTAAGMARAGGSMRFSVEALLTEACAHLIRGTKVPTSL